MGRVCVWRGGGGGEGQQLASDCHRPRVKRGSLLLAPGSSCGSAWRTEGRPKFVHVSALANHSDGRWQGYPERRSIQAGERRFGCAECKCETCKNARSASVCVPCLRHADHPFRMKPHALNLHTAAQPRKAYPASRPGSGLRDTLDRTGICARIRRWNKRLGLGWERGVGDGARP